MGGVDARYTVGREWCGYATPRWVARFCGEWVGQGASRAAARSLRDRHAEARLAAVGT